MFALVRGVQKTVLVVVLVFVFFNVVLVFVFFNVVLVFVSVFVFFSVVLVFVLFFVLVCVSGQPPTKMTRVTAL